MKFYRTRLATVRLLVLISWLSVTCDWASAQSRITGLPVITCIHYLGESSSAVIYLDRMRSALPSAVGAAYYEVYSRIDSAGFNIEAVTYAIPRDVRVARSLFTDYASRATVHQKEWALDGSLRSVESYRLKHEEVKLMGVCKAWHQNGQLARDGVYRKNGKLEKEICFDTSGRQVNCPQSWQFAQLPGQPHRYDFYWQTYRKFANATREFERLPETKWIEATFVIDSLGNIQSPRILGPISVPANWRDAALRVINDLPRFMPARSEGIVTPEPILLHLPTRW